jgi:steroid 5-alpha reductase family enzyme
VARFYSLVDAVWAYGIAVCAAGYAWMGEGWMPRRWLGAILGVAWGFRLGTHLFRRLRAHFPREDSRYEKLRVEWGQRLGFKSFVFFQFQALSQAFLALPFALAASDTSTRFHWNEYLALGVVLVGVCGETLADSQLARFKRDSAQRGKVCDTGLWRYSRHPNYFFEWVIWCGFGLWAIQAPWGVLALLCPALMLFLLLFVTGVPPAEAQSLQSRGESYRQYQRVTPRFFPFRLRKE